MFEIYRYFGEMVIALWWLILEWTNVMATVCVRPACNILIFIWTMDVFEWYARYRQWNKAIKLSTTFSLEHKTR